MTTLQHGQAPGVGTPEEKAVMGACNTQTAQVTVTTSKMLPPAEKIGKSVMPPIEHGEFLAKIGRAS